MATSVGFIGVGNMGNPMAGNVLKSFPLTVFDKNPAAMSNLVAAGAQKAGSAQEVVERSEIVMTCLPASPDVEALYLEPGGLVERARPGTILIDLSSVLPSTPRKIEPRAKARGVHFLEAPVSGGVTGARAATLAVMVGGDAEALESIRPVLERSAAEITHCGDVGAGAVAKLCNNLVQFQAWQGYVDAFRIGTASGLSDETLLQVLGWIMNDNARTFLAARKVLEQNPDNAPLRERFTSVMKLAEKDLHLALDVAYRVGVSVPGAALCSQQMARLFGVPDMQRR